MTAWQNGAEVLAQQQCSVVGCDCRVSVFRGRGPSHCPLCPEQPNLALRVLRDVVYCKAGCNQERLLAALAQFLQPVTDCPIGAVTRRPYRRRSCVVCGIRLEPGRRDRLVCGDTCRQRRHRSRSAALH